MTEVSIGRIVHYSLNGFDATSINKRRSDATSSGVAREETGYAVHVGNSVTAGDVFPLVVTRVWPNGLVNGQVLLDGNDTLWVTSVSEGAGNRQWFWPVRSDA